MKKIILIIACYCASFIGFSQEGPKITVFNSPDEKREQLEFGQNLFKFSILDAFVGDFNFAYERFLGERVSGEISVGVTLNNYLNQAVSENIDIDSSIEPLLGNSYAIGLKYYPGLVPDDYYFGFGFKHKYYHNDLLYTGSNGTQLRATETLKLNIPRLTFGYNAFLDEKVFFDLNCGVGIGRRVEEDYTLQNIYDPATNTNYQEASFELSNQLVPRFHVAAKIGINF